MRTTAAFSRHTLLALLEALILAALITGLLASAALINPGNHAMGVGNAAAASGKAWIRLNGASQLSVSGTNTASFSIGQSKTSEPWVRVDCTANGVLAYSQLLGYFPSWPYGEVFTFSSNYLNWNYDNSPLSCTADLEWMGAHNSEHVMASTAFTVSP